MKLNGKTSIFLAKASVCNIASRTIIPVTHSGDHVYLVSGVYVCYFRCRSFHHFAVRIPFRCWRKRHIFSVHYGFLQIAPSYVRLWIMICLANGFLSSLRHTTNYIELIVAATPNLFLLFKWQNQKLLHVHIHEKEKKAYTNDWKNDRHHNQTDLNRAPTKQLNDILFCVCSEFLCLIHRHKRKKKNQIWILKS